MQVMGGRFVRIDAEKTYIAFSVYATKRELAITAHPFPICPRAYQTTWDARRYTTGRKK